jgi:hypothetical protein
MTDAPITMKTFADTLRAAMDKWEEALMTAAKTGYMKDVEACNHVVELYGTQVESLLASGSFSGDAASALARWRDLTSSEAEYRRTQMELR